MSDDEEAKSLAGKIQNSILLEQLDKDGSTSQEQNSDSMPDVIQDQDMVTVMDYADIASTDSNKFAKKQSPEKPKPKKVAKSLA